MDEHKNQHNTIFNIGTYTHLQNQIQQRESNSKAQAPVF